MRVLISKNHDDTCYRLPSIPSEQRIDSSTENCFNAQCARTCSVRTHMVTVVVLIVCLRLISATDTATRQTRLTDGFKIKSARLKDVFHNRFLQGF